MSVNYQGTEIEDISTLSSDGQNVVDEADRFSLNVKTIYSIVDSLKEDWNGKSSQKYIDNIEKFRSDFESFGSTTSDFGTLIKTIGDDYQNLEDTL